MKFVQLLSLYTRLRRESRTRRKPVATRPQARASAFVLEFLETRVMLSATLLEVPQATASAPNVTAAVVTTDHPDYASGETAVIATSNATGDGPTFSTGELVRFQVTRTDGILDDPMGPTSVAPAGNTPWYVTDGVGGFAAHQDFDATGAAIDRDADGMADWIAPDNDLTVNSSISTSWFVEEQYRGASLLLTAAGQESGAVAKTAFTDANAKTATVVTSSAATSTYGDTLTFTATITAATGVNAPTGGVEFFDGATSMGIVNVPSSISGTTSTWNLTLASLSAGTHAISAVYTATGDFNGSTSANIAQTVNKATAVINVAGYSATYDGAAHTATGTVVSLLSDSPLIPIQIGAGVLDVSSNGITNNAPYGNNGYRYLDTLFAADQEAQITLADAPAAGSGHAVVVFLRTQNPNTPTLNAYYIAYQEAGANGSWIVGRSIDHSFLTVQSVPGTQLAAGDKIRASVVGDTVTASAFHNGVWTTEVSHTMIGGDVVTGPGYFGLEISGNSPEVRLTNFIGGAYSGGAAMGVLGESLSGLSVSGATYINAGTYSDPWTFTDVTGNYQNASGSVVTTIAKATATVTGYTGVYDGAAHGATVKGVLGESLSGLSTATHTNAGTYVDTWTYTDSTGNYKNTSGNVTNSITKATVTVTVSGYKVTYDGAAHTATGTAVGLQLGETLPIPIQIGGGLLDVSTDGITNNALYGNNGYRMVNTVFPADQEAQVTLTGAPSAGSNHSVFVFLRTQNPNTTSLNAYYIGYQETGASGTWIVGRYINFNGLTVNNVFGTLLAAGDKIQASVVGNTVTGYSFHNGVWKAEVSYTMTGADIVSGPGYLGVEISGNSPEIRLTNLIGGGYTGVFGASDGAAGTAKGVLGESLSGLDLSGMTHTNAGTYSDPWTFTDVTGNYNNTSGTVSDSIAKATATVTVSGYTGVYDGAAHGATGTAVGVLGENLSPGLTLGAAFINIPGGTANWMFSGGPNYLDQSDSVAIVISSPLTDTTTTVTSSGTLSTYGTAVTFTAVVSNRSGTAAPTGTVEFFDGATSLGILSVANSTGTGTATWSLTTAGLTAGAHTTIRAVYTPIGNFATSISANLTQTVTQKTLTGTFTVADKLYDGTTAATVLTRTLTGVLAGDVATVSLTGGTATFDNAYSGNNKTVTLSGATLAGPVASNYSLASVGTTTASITPVEATVRYVATTGDDSNSGTIDSPWRTIQKAANTVNPGDVVYIRGGTYVEYVLVTRNGAPGNPITFQSYPSENAILDGSGFPIFDSGPNGLFWVRGAYITVKNMEMQNANYATAGTEDTHDVIIDTIHAHDGKLTGVYLWNSDYITVTNCIIHDMYNPPYDKDPAGGGNADGIGTIIGNTNLTITYNIVYGCSDDGIDIWAAQNSLIKGNISYHNGYRSSTSNVAAGNGNGYKMGGGGGGSSIFIDNISFDNRARGFDANSGEHNTLYNNTSVNNGWLNYLLSSTDVAYNNISYGPTAGNDNYGGATQGTNSWNLGIANPQFLSTDLASPNFMRLAPGSPAINVGTTISGNSHVCVGNCDLGAYD